MVSTTVGCRELKLHLGAYLDQVRKGRRIVITDRGRPIAELNGISGQEGYEQRLQDFVSGGRGTWSKRTPLPPLEPILPAKSGVSEALDADREDRF